MIEEQWRNYDCYKDITENPPNDVIVEIAGEDYMGAYTMLAKRLDYKIGNKSRKKWRWVREDGIALERKEIPTKWRDIDV